MRFFHFKINSWSSNRKGFTLIELLIVIALIGILSGIAVPIFQSYSSKAKINTSKKICSETASFITAEIGKCLGGTNLASAYNSTSMNTCSKDPLNISSEQYRDYFISKFNVDLNAKNIYKPDQYRFISESSPQNGEISLKASNNSLQIVCNNGKENESDLISNFYVSTDENDPRPSTSKTSTNTPIKSISTFISETFDTYTVPAYGLDGVNAWVAVDKDGNQMPLKDSSGNWNLFSGGIGCSADVCGPGGSLGKQLPAGYKFVAELARTKETGNITSYGGSGGMKYDFSTGIWTTSGGTHIQNGQVIP